MNLRILELVHKRSRILSIVKILYHFGICLVYLRTVRTDDNSHLTFFIVVVGTRLVIAPIAHDESNVVFVVDGNDNIGII